MISILMEEIKDSVSIQLYKQYREFAPSCFFILGSYACCNRIYFTVCHIYSKYDHEGMPAWRDNGVT